MSLENIDRHYQERLWINRCQECDMMFLVEAFIQKSGQVCSAFKDQKVEICPYCGSKIEHALEEV